MRTPTAYPPPPQGCYIYAHIRSRSKFFPKIFSSDFSSLIYWYLVYRHNLYSEFRSYQRFKW